MAAILKFFKRYLLPNHIRLSWNLMRSIGATQRFRIAKIVPFRYPRWLPWHPSWNSSNDISSQTVSRIEPKLDGRHHSDTDSELLKSFCSSIQDGRHLLPNHRSDWAETWWEASVKWFCSNIQDGRHDVGALRQVVSWIEPKLDGRHHCDTDIQNC